MIFRFSTKALVQHRRLASNFRKAKHSKANLFNNNPKSILKMFQEVNEDGKESKVNDEMKREESTQEIDAREVLDSSNEKLFYMSRPKHCVDGISQGVGNILSGALGGAAMLITSPIIGAYQGGQNEGVLGAVKGFGFGLGVGAVGGVVAAVGNAVYLLINSCYNCIHCIDCI